jgi:hypothetical protein
MSAVGRILTKLAGQSESALLRSEIAGAESFHSLEGNSLEGNMCGTAMRGADALPESKATSRAKGSLINT